MELRYPLFFHHSVKTGGTSLVHWLKEVFPPPTHVNMLAVKTPHPFLEEYKTLSPEAIREKRVVFGHSANQALPLFPTARHIGLARDPAAHAISRYMFHRQMCDEGRVAPESMDDMAQPLPGEAQLDRILEAILQWCAAHSANQLTHELAAYAQALGAPVPQPNQVTPMDIEPILDTFAYVGVTDELPLLAFLLVGEYDLPPVPIRTINETKVSDKPYRPVEMFFPESFKDELRRLSNLDAALYNAARERLEKDACRLFNSGPAPYLEYIRYRTTCSSPSSTPK